MPRTSPPAWATCRCGPSAACRPDGLVLDPFGGAGITGVAALRLGRRCSGTDIDPGCHQQVLTRLSPHLA
ncbi:DNA methyltransferase [Longispora sp. NPDC051575]|uniref:DNA methyltransferase n=1 Tax=Longispora sp. NPDC051575 TaxID=3154943 RepID=UPI0034257290